MITKDPWHEIIAKSPLIGKDVTAEEEILGIVRDLQKDKNDEATFIKIEPALLLLIESGTQFSAQKALAIYKNECNTILASEVKGESSWGRESRNIILKDYIACILKRNPHPYFLQECGDCCRRLLYSLQDNDSINEIDKTITRGLDELSFTVNGKSSPAGELLRDFHGVIAYCRRKLILTDALKGQI